MLAPHPIPKLEDHPLSTVHAKVPILDFHPFLLISSYCVGTLLPTVNMLMTCHIRHKLGKYTKNDICTYVSLQYLSHTTSVIILILDDTFLILTVWPSKCQHTPFFLARALSYLFAHICTFSHYKTYFTHFTG